jgi:hypothetical protein
MAKSIKISPIRKTYNAGFKTLESSLSDKGYARSPGTKRYLMPKVEADGRYRTGLDKTAQYLLKLTKEERDAEFEFIDETLKKLKEVYPDTDFGPRSKVWNAFSDSQIKVSHVPLGNEPFILYTDTDSLALLTYCWLRVHPDISRSLEDFNRGGCPECQYYLANEEAENKALFSKKKQINQAVVTFENLTPSKQKQVARLMGLPISDDSTEEAVYNMMDSTLKKPEFESGEYKNLSTLAVFNDLVRLTDDRLEVRDLIEQAIRHNIYRKGTGDKIQEGSETVAGSREDLVNFLLDDNNQKELLALKSRIKQKKIAMA